MQPSLEACVCVISYLEEAPNAVGHDLGNLIVGRLLIGREATENATDRRLIKKH